MKLAVIFDMDGVIVHSEHLWVVYEPPYLQKLLGPDAMEKIGSTFGVAISQVYEKAKSHGYNGTKETFYAGYETIADTLYRKAPITGGVEDLFVKIKQNGYALGVVSSSPMNTITAVLGRLKNFSSFDFIESVDDHKELRPKPYPDGYLAAMKHLGVTPAQTIIVEDSPKGIAAAKAAGAYVIGFTEHLTSEPSSEADAYAKNMHEVQRLIQTFASSALK